MYIPPRRRRRILRVHHLRQQGQSLRQIAAQLNVAHATVRSDLQLVESHWSEIAAPAADDLLLDALHLLRRELAHAVDERRLTDIAQRLPLVEFLRANDARVAQVVALVRETRRTANEIQRRAAQREAQPGLDSQDSDVQNTEAQDREAAQQTAEDSPESSTPIQPAATISRPEQEIVAADRAAEKTPPETIQPHPDPLMDPIIDPIIEEAVALFPDLDGKPRREILNFIKQLTDPIHQQDPRTYADAAGGG